MGNLRNLTRVGFWAASALVGLLLFQNCSRLVPSEDTADSGGGINGLRYLSYGVCPGNQLGVADTIVIPKDSDNAAITQQNCQILGTPLSVNIQNLQFGSNSSVFSLNGRNYDLQVNSPGQRVTLQFCQAPGVQAYIWQQVGNASAYFGSVVLADGTTTGTLNVQAPTNGDPNHFVTSTSQGSQFDLNLDVTPNTLNYTIGSGTPASVSNLTCSIQSPASIPDDGSEEAVAAMHQEASLLTSYPIRAFWNVAGVDYSVGYPVGQTLKDPTTDPTLASNPSVTIDSANLEIDINGNNVTLDGYDFTLHGGYAIVFQTGSNLAITNSNVLWAETQAGAANMTVTNCTFPATTNWAYIQHAGSGTLTIEYNWFTNYPEKAILTESTATSTVVVKYNMFESNGASGANKDISFESDGTFPATVVDFNTFNLPTGFNGNEFITMGSTNLNLTGEAAYNTMIAKGSSTQLVMSYMTYLEGGPTSNVTVQVHNNYIDPSGSYGPFYYYPNGNGTEVNYLDNFNMLTGALLVPN